MQNGASFKNYLRVGDNFYELLLTGIIAGSGIMELWSGILLVENEDYFVYLAAFYTRAGDN